MKHACIIVLLLGTLFITVVAGDEVERNIRKLNEGDVNEQEKAVFALSNLNDTRAADALIKAITEERPGGVSAEAAIVLGKLRDPRAVEPLIDTLKSKDPEKRGAAATALGDIKDHRAIDPLINTLAKEQDGYRSSEIWALGELRASKAYDLIIKILNDKDADIDEKIVAAEAIGKLGNGRAFDPLLEIFKDGGEELDLRNAAIFGLGELGDKRAVDPLIQALHEENGELSEKSAEALGKLNDTRDVEPLVQILDAALYSENYGCVTLYEIIFRSLGKLKDPRAAETLIRLLDQRPSAFDQTIIWALGEIGDQRAIKPLEKISRGDHYFTRDKDDIIHEADKALEKLGVTKQETSIQVGAYENDKTTPVPEAEIFIDSQLKGTTDTDGILFIHHVLSGKYRIVAHKEGAFNGALNHFCGDIEVDVPDPSAGDIPKYEIFGDWAASPCAL